MPSAPAARAADTEVIVVGGGLIGLLSAHALARAGRSVTIIDRERPGSGAARGNAGEITPLNALPLAGPAMAAETLRGVLSRTHYLNISPLALPRLVPFGLSFLAHCAPRRVAAGARALDQLARGAFAAYDALAAEGFALAGGGTGYLYTHPDERVLEAHRRSLIARADHLGVAHPEPILRGAEVREAEPLLAASVNAAYIAPTERFIDPGLFVDELIARLTELGARFVSGVAATTVIHGGSRPAVLTRSASGERLLTAQSVIVAAGSRTDALLSASGIRVPARLRVRPGRGYSFTVESESLPTHLLGSLAERTVAIPMNGRLRIVGLMDFDGSHDRSEPAREAHLAHRASRFLRGIDWDATSEHWVGPRPMTGSGLPIISALPGDPRIVVASGHNMHGLSLGPVTGDIVAALVAGEPPRVSGADVDLRPFALPS
ncbi:FAD-binding oxidoreductase [Leucobacter sp. CSA2]|uniref:FAD-binding oxidoreductase n=1 Tax=Leucobacter edaphi TaxID=2796472 RepID=A0A934QEN4_9MICO|nr:FAD-binding oxidoreductase [Leucobacter edaphi]MBK0421932.1 FAD-binding oxidoreductase [Leucobacter edaphi]